jgi:hypothetical protein
VLQIFIAFAAFSAILVAPTAIYRCPRMRVRKARTAVKQVEVSQTAA